MEEAEVPDLLRILPDSFVQKTKRGRMVEFHTK
jgi:hypothetical protein